MSSKPTLRLDWCSYQAAKYAVEHWHYSGRMPRSKLVTIGVWEGEKFIGAVIFGVGATSDLVKRYGLTAQQGCELVRIALTNHKTPVSRIVSIALRKLKQDFHGLRLIVSFADPAQAHHGGIYQAGNWVYTGLSGAYAEYVINGRRMHGRTVHAVYGSKRPFKDCLVMGNGKHRYLYPLDAAMREQIVSLAKPYPKRPCAESVDSDTPAFHAGEGSATLTSALHGDTTQTLEAAR